MRHQVAGRKLNRTHSHRKALLNNLASQLFEHKKVHTTEAKAKELRHFAENLITKAKNALLKEKQGVVPDGQKIDVHSRRMVGRYIRKKAVLQELFDSIAPVVESRNGGYTRVVKTGVRRGDNARTAFIELVDFAAPQDGATSTKKKKKAAKKVESKAKNTTVSPIEKPNIIAPQSVEAVEEANNPVVAQVTEVANEKVVFDDTADVVTDGATPIANDSDVSDSKISSDKPEDTEENKA